MKKISWVNFILGLWLIVAPFALFYRGISAALWDNVIVGIIIAVLAGWRALGKESVRMTVTSWVVALLGLWTLVAPFALRYAGNANAMWNNVIVGIVVAILATYRALDRSSIQPLQHQNQGAH
jgi:SPW repeat